MARFMLLLHGDDDPNLSPEEMQRIVGEYSAWAQALGQRGHLRDGAELAPGGKLIQGSGNAVTVTDGPFTEAKEAIGGYFLLDAADEAEAVALAQECPGLRRGSSVQLRPLMDHGEG